MGGGARYLAENSPFRGAGTTNIAPALLAELRRKTTYPPTFLTNTISTDTTLQPIAQRDTGLPDIGYHYDPIDYLVCSVVSNATVVLTNGVVLGYFSGDTHQYKGLDLKNRSQLVSGGTANQRNYLVYFRSVQEEQPEGWHIWGGSSCSPGPFRIAAAASPCRKVDLRFTTLCAADAHQGDPMVDSVQTISNAFTLQDCEIYAFGDHFNLSSGDGAAVTLKNNLFQAAWVSFTGSGTLSAWNNLFACNGKNVVFSPGTSASWTIQDNAFEGCGSTLGGTFDHNAYLNGATAPSSLQAGDIVTNLSWASGPLGEYYQLSTNLVNRGSRSAADAGLYHYTVQTNQVKEMNSVADCGYHYVAVGADNLPVDTDGDGVPDYLEDANGNGQVDSGEADWLNNNSWYGLTTSGPGKLQVFTPLK